MTLAEAYTFIDDPGRILYFYWWPGKKLILLLMTLAEAYTFIDDPGRSLYFYWWN